MGRCFALHEAPPAAVKDVQRTDVAPAVPAHFANTELFFAEEGGRAPPLEALKQELTAEGTQSLEELLAKADKEQEAQRRVKLLAEAAASEDEAGEERPYYLPPKRTIEAVDLNCASIEDILGKSGALAKRQEHFCERAGQLEMAHAVEECFQHHDLLLAEAGTGTGKTYAYLVPALLAGRTVVISTGSKALQDQLVKFDIPKLLDLIGHSEIPFMGLKGFNNYLCLRRFKQAVQERELKEQEVRQVEAFNEREQQRLLLDPQHCTFGDVNAAFPYELSSKLITTRKRCLGDKCPFYSDQCFAFKARQYAAESRILVINHALLFASLSSQQILSADNEHLNLQSMSLEDITKLASSGQFSQHYWFLPHFNALICDEAHMLPEYGRTYYSEQFDSADLSSWCENALRELKRLKFAGRGLFRDEAAKLLQASAAVQAYLAGRESRCNFLELKYLNYKPDLPREQLQVNQDFRGHIVKLYTELRAMLKLLLSHQSFAPQIFDMLSDEIREMMGSITAAMNCDEPGKGAQADRNHVCCAEVGPRRFAITLMPLEIGPYFSKDLCFLLSRGTGVAMTSATLSVRGSFAKFACDIGAQQLKTRELIVQSEFDYAKQACLYLSKDFPAVNDPQRNEQILKQLLPLMEEVPGGIFFLTTSHRSLQECAELITKHFAGRRTVLVQTGGLSNARMMRRFKQDGRAVLVGTSSFWAGVDVPGQALSLVIIDKLPFASPTDPFEQARSAKLKSQGGSPFMQLSLPEAIIALRQGVGRLIRSEHDQGGLIICDPRVFTASYGRRMIDALPPMHRCASLEEMTDFFRKMELHS